MGRWKSITERLGEVHSGLIGYRRLSLLPERAGGVVTIISCQQDRIGAALPNGATLLDHLLLNVLKYLMMAQTIGGIRKDSQLVQADLSVLKFWSHRVGSL